MLRMLLKIQLAVIILLSLSLSSCYTQKSLTGRGEPITADIKSKIQPGKIHFITPRYGKRLKVYVTSVDSVKMYGKLYSRDAQGNSIKSPFEDSFESLEKNAIKVEVRKINPWTTGLLLCSAIIMIPVIIGGPFAYE